METDRLTALAAVLHRLAEQRTYRRSLGLPVPSACSGTAAHAIEIAASRFQFVAQGFRLEPIGRAAALVPRYQELEGAAAVESFFGLTSFWTEVLFDPESYDETEVADPGAVARRIYWFVKSEAQAAAQSASHAIAITA
jgi:hypothetical protein